MLLLHLSRLRCKGTIFASWQKGSGRMLKKRIPIGIEDYREMIERDYYYVDKTLLIKELVDQWGKVTLITRPRRFGKTLGLSTIRRFFEDERDRKGNKIDNLQYFAGKKIIDAGEEYLSHAGVYPVIKLSLKSAKQPDFDIAYKSLVSEIAGEYGRHEYVLETDALKEEEKERYISIRDRKGDYQQYAESVKILSNCLERYHGKPAIILIDEYDVPLENAWFEGFYDKMIKFIRALFESALKTNDSLAFAVVTGCLRISRESIFTGLNNLNVISILSRDFGEHFGFIPEEVGEMLDFYEIGSYKETARKWYDGYLFGASEVYNPWSVINFVYNIANGTTKFAKPYWSNTSSNSIVRDLVERADLKVRREIEALIDGGTIEKPVHEDITYGDIYDSQDNLWNFLFFTGYLKKCGERQEGEQVYLAMSIPNAEIAYIYKNTVLSWFDKKIRKTDMTPLMRAIEQGDCGTFGTFLSAQLMDTISFFDYKESYYHGFLAGILTCFDKYVVLSNRENGLGRSDIVMEDYGTGDRGIILELKVAKKYSEMEELCDEALEQIENMQYEQNLREDGYVEILKYGICFFKKRCMVKKAV